MSFALNAAFVKTRVLRSPLSPTSKWCVAQSVGALILTNAFRILLKTLVAPFVLWNVLGPGLVWAET